jgi:P4 family phage/plasmid primase-like protien
LKQKIRNANLYGDSPKGWKLHDASSEPNGSDGDHPDDNDLDNSEDRPVRYSDDALANAFSEKFAATLKYVPAWGWLEWAGERWRRIFEVLVMDRARPICRSAAQQCLEDPDVNPTTRERLARSIASARTVAAVERLARGDWRHYTEVSSWDADLWSFNTPGGTVDLKTGALRNHRREDFITKISNATPTGDCPQWLAFLKRVTAANQELQDYLQRLAGYSLVGDPLEECLDFFHGKGGNGKGTYLDTLQFIFGEYGTTAATETFLEKKGERHPCDVAKLAGARLVVAQEVDEGQYWDESKIKSMTGRDVLTARFMRQDFFDFKPQFTLIIAGNHKPALKTVDASIRRRFHLVPFSVEIPVGEQDVELKERLRGEADGILKWIVQGCIDWQRQRLNPPNVVLTATADYLQEEDTIELWLSECCIQGKEFEEPSSPLYESFRRWKQERGEKPPGQKTFTNRLVERGFERDRNSAARTIAGLRLTDEEAAIVNKIIEDREAGRQRKEWWNRD